MRIMKGSFFKDRYIFCEAKVKAAAFCSGLQSVLQIDFQTYGAVVGA